MASTPQPAKKSYFFGKGYRDVGNTIPILTVYIVKKPCNR